MCIDQYTCVTRITMVTQLKCKFTICNSLYSQCECVTNYT